MSKKLLNESTIRRFMGLANLEPLSESFLESQVNEEEVSENEEVVEESESVEEADTVEEGGTAARSENAAKNRVPADRMVAREGQEVQEENLVAIAEDDAEELEDDAAYDMGAATDDMADAAGEEDLADELGLDDEAAAEGEDLATRAQSILSDLADLLTQAGIETTVTSDEEAGAEMDAEMDVAIDATDAGDEMEDAEDDLDDAEDLVAEDGGKAGDIKGTMKKDGHHGRGPKTKETAKEEGDIDYEKNESKKSSVDALVAEITSKVISRLNK